ncbi:hypothetical protein R3P38DRAFT_2905804 [Favolaschia claudopus]|uniref:Secreted protein n=1 Tax=Favolaschia claudopus TaxID=2862362 RepID=A0AAW0CFU6_9AGAR
MAHMIMIRHVRAFSFLSLSPPFVSAVSRHALIFCSCLSVSYLPPTSTPSLPLNLSRMAPKCPPCTLTAAPRRRYKADPHFVDVSSLDHGYSDLHSADAAFAELHSTFRPWEPAPTRKHCGGRMTKDRTCVIMFAPGSLIRPHCSLVSVVCTLVYVPLSL